MRVVSLQEFLALPSGTLFSFVYGRTYHDRRVPGSPYFIDERTISGLHIKEETLEYEGKPHDFFYSDLSPSDMNCLADQKPAPDRRWQFEEAGSRWGVFDDKDTFLVYEPEDLKMFRQMLERLVPQEDAT